jgi:hypothetical protein
MEIGVAVTVGVPIFTTSAPSDLTLREYVKVVPTLSEALSRATTSPRPRCAQGLLIDPHASVEEAHHILVRIEAALTCQNASPEPANIVYRGMAELQTKLGLPTCVH